MPVRILILIAVGVDKVYNGYSTISVMTRAFRNSVVFKVLTIVDDNFFWRKYAAG